MNDSITEDIQWGSAVTLPAGAVEFAAHNSRQAAIADVGVTNRAVGVESARLVYRTRKSTPWRDDPTGNTWGVRISWPDGHEETEPRKSREDADREVRVHRLTSSTATARTVSRDVEYGDWRLAAVSPASEGARAA